MVFCEYCNTEVYHGICPFCRGVLSSTTEGLIISDIGYENCFHCGRAISVDTYPIPQEYRRYIHSYSTVIACPNCRTPFLYSDFPHDIRARYRQYRAQQQCFIATAAYDTPFAQELNILREWRDQILMKKTIGRVFIRFYYKISPPIAFNMARSEKIKYCVRLILHPIIKILKN